MVALAAVGLSRVDTDDEFMRKKVDNWWARRVFVATRAMNGRAGRALERHRPELIPEIRRLLDEATNPRTLDDGTEVAVPEVVLTARDVALGNAPPPTAKVKAKPVYIPPKEPDLSDLEDELGPTKVERAGDPNFGNN
jgi:AcrR family transcriptional regulator